MSEHVTKAFAAIVKATTTDPTGHLPNCGYTDESQVCGCAAWGARLHDALTASLGDAYRRGQRDLAAKVEAVLTTWQRELADYPDTEGGRAARAAVRIAAGEIRDVLADALPQDADSEPASVPTNAREGGNGQDHAGEGERPADRHTAAQEDDLAALEYLMRVQRRATSDDVREIAAELEAELRAKTRDGGAGL